MTYWVDKHPGGAYNIQKWSLKGHIAKGSRLNKSGLHLKARKLIKECFPTLQILEEVGAPIRKNETFKGYTFHKLMPERTIGGSLKIGHNSYFVKTH